MDIRFSVHNIHQQDPALFSVLDPQLRSLKEQPYVFQPEFLSYLPSKPGIYTLGGGRQIGKTTLLKQCMAKLLGEGIPPENIAFFTGELIDDHHSLLNLLTHQLECMSDGRRYLFLDEVTYIRDWDKAVKYAADAGMLEDTLLFLTGSDLIFIQEGRMRFPGRRGQAPVADFHLFPLSFREFVVLTKRVDLQAVAQQEPLAIQALFAEFNQYLLHGGYLTAINDLARTGFIGNATLSTYSDWIRGDMLKHGKQEPYLRQVLNAIFKHYGSQITWNNLAKELTIDHPKTVADYIGVLENMDAVFVQHALVEDKLAAAPKKARKVIFTDPFIYHAIRAFLKPASDPWTTQILAAVADSELCSQLVEACVTAHYRRFYPVYYIKADAGEVDIAYLDQERFWPIEIKWTQQLRPKNLKQIIKYPNAKIFTYAKQSGVISGVPAIPLPIALLELGTHK